MGPKKRATFVPRPALAARRRQALLQETPAARQARRAADAARQALSRALEMPEARQARLADNAQRQVAFRARQATNARQAVAWAVDPFQVGELFKRAGHVLNQLADLTMQIHAIPSQPPSGLHSKSRMKKRHHSESGTSVNVSEIKKSPVSDQKPVFTEAGIDRHNSGQATKKSKLSEVTLSALNSPELDVDIEDLEDSSSPGKKMKLAFESDTDTGLL